MVRFIETDSSVLYDQIITAMESAVGEPLYPGDERRIYSEALVALIVGIYNEVNEACKNKMLAYASGEILDALGERTDTKRLEASRATTILRFSMNNTLSTDVVIPAGSRVTPDSKIYFSTVQTSVIEAGRKYVDVLSKAETPGADCNGYVAGSIKQMVDIIQYIDAVTNINESAGGNDGEPYTEDGDNNYRERIRLSVTKFTTAGPKESYRYYAMSANAAIQDVAITSPEPGKVLITPICKGGIIPSESILQQIKDICSADNVRPMTDYVLVAAPTQVEYTLSLKYYTTQEDEKSCVEAIEGGGGAIEQYLNWQDTKLGRDINPDKLRALCLNPSNGVGCIRLDVISPSRVIISENEIAAHNVNISVTHEVVEE